VASQTDVVSWRDEHPSAKYITPFIAFMLLLLVGPRLGLAPEIEAPTRVLILAAVCWICWPREISLRPAKPFSSVAIGALVFVLWIAPEFVDSGYRDNLLFSNSLVGHIHSSLQSAALHNPWVLTWRTVRAVLIVPVVEELFWRGWLMRKLIQSDFQTVPLGSYSPFAFWATAILFAAEHGPYWDVGLLTGVIYNVWMIRSKSIASCILMHAVTNAILSGYVITTAHWQYWQ